MLGFEALAVPAVGAENVANLRSAPKLVVAIDAPLSFPKAFRNLLNGKASTQSVPATEIESRLAYRDCERWVKKEFGKKPLSAPFDKLGNNASLAMSVASALQQEDHTVVPQSAERAARAVIEVYPGLVKAGSRKADPAIPEVARHLPENLDEGTDRYDAAICAVVALVFLGGGAQLGLPDLVPFPHGADPEEGWIFTLPAEFLRRG